MAKHNSALLHGRDAPVELEPEFARFGARLCGSVRAGVADVVADPAVRIVSRGTQTVAGADLHGTCAPLIAASRHLFGVAGHALYLALDGQAILEQLDRTFGGAGQIEAPLPAELPHTARVLSQRFEKQVLAAVASELRGLEFRAAESSAADLATPFAPDAELTVLTLEVMTQEREWHIVLAVETTALSSLLPKRASAPRAPVSRRKRGIDEAPFADLPLAASARLVDMEMPLHRLATIAAGTVLPIMVARSVPLQVGEIVIARGTVGEVDDQVALQITQTFTGQTTPGKEIR